MSDNIEIPRYLIERVDEILEYTSFEDRAELVVFIIEEVIQSTEVDKNQEPQVDEDVVANRLEELGYLEQ